MLMILPVSNVLAEEEIIAEEVSFTQESAPDIPGLIYEREMEFQYATCARVYYYEGGYKYFSIYDGTERYLLVPEGKEVPDGLESDVIVLQAPLSDIYVAATATMALFDSIDAMGQVRMSSQTEDGWYIQAAKDAMNAGDMVYAGKYSAPDFEILVRENCRLAVESTMIFHSPKIKEMIEKLGIPVFIDRSSYESHPLGRPEWAKVYGALLDKEEQAETFFSGQEQIMEGLQQYEATGKTVAFFYVNSNGSVVVRSNEDYVPKMISLAGGKYALEGIQINGESAKKSSLEITMEDFYANVCDADYLIYNSTIDAPIDSIADLLEKSSLFAGFKAVEEGNVWCADKYLYQATDIVGELINDFALMMNDGSEEEMTFLRKID